MFAIIGYKRPDPTNEGKVEVAFEVRSIGCFNGLNCADAFTPRPAQYANQSFDLVLSNINPDGRLPDDWFHGDTYRNGWGQQRVKCQPHMAMAGLNEERLSIATNGDGWECIGLGWLSYELGQFRSQYEPVYANVREGIYTTPGQPRYNSQAHYNMDARVAALLARNTIARTYYDAWQGTERTSHRKVTNNEQFMRNIVGRFSGGLPINNFSSWFKGSRVLNGIMWNNYHKMMHFEFVGSERPSGVAVSYLQIYRNCAEKLFAGNASNGMNAGARQLLGQMYTHWAYSTTDPVPLISMICNNGSDSDIVSFAGRYFVGYAMKHSLLECAYLYGNKNPMVVEGRYNKGQQSADIRYNLDREIQNGNHGEKFTDVASKLNIVHEYIEHQARRPGFEGAEYAVQETLVNRRAHGRPESTAEEIAEIFNAEVARAITPWMVRNLSFNLHQIVSDIKGVLATGIPCFRPRPTRAKSQELSRESLGFVDWVRQAEGQRPELQAEENTYVHAGELGVTLGDTEGTRPETPVDRILADAPTREEAVREFHRDAFGRFATRH